MANTTVQFGWGGSTVTVGTQTSDESKITFGNDYMTKADDGSYVLSFKENNGNSLNRALAKNVTVSGSAVEVSVFDASSMNKAATISAAPTIQGLKTLKLGSAADKLTIASTGDMEYNTGSGKDYVELTDGADKATLTLGAGADTLKASANGKVKLTDYNKSEDVILITDNEAAVLGADGKLTAGSAGSAGSAEIDFSKEDAKFYDVVVTNANNEKKKTEYYTATGDATKISLNQGNYDVVVNLTAAGVASELNLTKKASVTLNASNGEADVIKAGASSTVSVTGFNAEEDKLVLTGTTLANLNLKTVNSDVVVSNAKANSVTLAGVANDSILDINGKKVLARTDTSNNNPLTQKEGAELFYSIKEGTILEANDVKAGTKINLADTNTFKNINGITLTDDLSAAKGLQIFGTAGKIGDTINVSANEQGVLINTNGVSTVSAVDVVTLGDGADTIVIDAAKNNMKVNNFTAVGTEGKEADVLDFSKTSVDTFTRTAKITGGKLTMGKTTVDLCATAANVNDVIKVKASNGNTYNVAADFDNSTGVQIKLKADTKVDYYAFNKKLANSVTVKNSEENENATYTLLNSALNGVKNVKVDGSAMTGNMIIQGAQNVTTGAGADNVWAYGTKGANITLSTDENVDTVWFKDGVDKDVTVTGMTYSTDEDAVNNQIKIIGVNSVAELMSNYKFTTNGTSTVIKGLNDGAKMTVDTTTVKLVGGTEEVSSNTSAVVAKVGATDSSVDFTKDATIYTGMKTLNTTSDIDSGYYAIRLGSAAGKFDGAANFNSYYVSDSVTTFDASASTDATFIIQGSATKNSELTGASGGSKNYLYGGGSTKDVMNGVDEAEDVFYYGKNDGSDTINIIGEEDTINLYDVTYADFTNGAASFSIEKGTISVGDYKLTVTGGFVDGMTVQLADAKFTYSADAKDGKGDFVPKA